MFLFLMFMPPINTAEMVIRTESQMCHEVAIEINIQVEEGMITQQKGRQVINRCFEMFGGAK